MLAVIALLLVPAGASAASPVLEFVVQGHSLSEVSFTTTGGELSAQMAGFETLVHCTASHGEGEITGPRSTVSKYQFTGCSAEGPKCKSGANAEEITTGPIVGDLVYIDQAKEEVGILMNPGGGTYIKFECGGTPAEGRGSFLALVNPVNQEATSFTATLSQSNSVQTPDEYEGEKGEPLYAFPTGEKEGNPFVPTGVESTFTIHSNLPGEIKAVTTQDIEAEQHEEEAEKQDEALLKQEETLKKQEATLKKQEAVLKGVEEHANQLAEEAKRHEAELNAQIAAIKKRQQEATAEAEKDQQEVIATKKQLEESKSLAQAKLLKKALEQCKTKPKNRRAQCKARAEKKYGSKAKTGKQ